MPPSPQDHEQALRQWLSEQYPGQEYRLVPFPIDVPGWAFFETRSQQARSDLVMYHAVRDDGSVVDEEAGEAELALVLAAIELFTASQPPTAVQLAHMVLTTLAVSRQNLVEMALDAKSFNTITKGARLEAPNLKLGRSSAELTFWTKWSARSLLVWRYKVKVNKAYGVKVRAKQKKIRFK